MNSTGVLPVASTLAALLGRSVSPMDDRFCRADLSLSHCSATMGCVKTGLMNFEMFFCGMRTFVPRRLFLF